MNAKPKVYLEFECMADAVEYRKTEGCGGLIFAVDDGQAYIFPVGMTPTQVMTHNLTRGLNGHLIGQIEMAYELCRT